MTKKQRAPVFYDTGGKGIMPTSNGEAYRWWVPYQYTSMPRLLMATRLAMGPATLKELEVVTGGYQSVTWHIIRNWVGQHFAQWETVEGGGRRGGRRWREVSLTEDGRRDLWRYGWVTRRLRFSPGRDVPLRDDVPSDPLGALRAYGRSEFLRPAALAVLEELIGWPKQNEREMGAHTGLRASVRCHVRHFREAGFLHDCGYGRINGSCIKYPRWMLNAEGHLAVDRHVDVMRRVAGASGYVPTKSCEYYYPCEDMSPCAISRGWGGEVERCGDCWHWDADGD